ncbi:MAG: serine hydrolase [Gammaproteobacteria bacterium]|nr:serine hydrolase [Gammaproteobacteria bacterium]
MRFAFAVSVLFLCACTETPDLAPDSRFTGANGVALTAEQIDSTVEHLMQAGDVPGLALALISDGEVAYVKAYGFADVDEGRALETDTVMYAASLTKAAFAYTVMTLVDEGVVDLDRLISDYLPRPLEQYEDYADLAGDPRWRIWTLRMLLSHNAGLPNWRWFSDSQKLEIIFEPGSRYAYSGEGIQVAQLVLEEGLGLDVNALMQERVFEKFGMRRTSMLWRDDFRPNFSRGFDEEGNNLGHNARQSVRAAGSMDTTVDDFASFLAGVLRGDGLTQASRVEMLSAQVKITAEHQFPSQFPVDTNANQDIQLAYGLGWGIFASPFGPAFFKEGHDDGTNNYALCLDEAQRCILILSNSSNGEGIFLYLVDALIGETNLPWEWEGYVPYDRK